VTWNDAQAFLKWLNGMNANLTFRLPTEAEWEYACRAGTTDEVYGDLDSIAWYKGDSYPGGFHPVGQKRPNAFGLFDMLGNAEQWCQDWFDAGYYAASPSQDPQGPDQGSFRVVRGGSWFSPAADVRATLRDLNSPDTADGAVGFRVVAIARTR
jgi:formylglycine-generating enzyme required for sulfatase activity